MKKIVGLALILLTALALTILTILSCETTEPPIRLSTVYAYLDKPFTVRAGQTAKIFQTGLSVTFRRFDYDDRCCDVCFCTWEGMAAGDFFIQGPNVDGPHYLCISGAPDSANIEMLSQVIAGYKFTLQDLWPLRDYGLDIAGKITAPIAPLPPDNATLLVTRANEVDSLSGAVALIDLDPEFIQLGMFNLLAAAINNDILGIDLTYSGGCRPHYFWAFMSPSTFTDGSPRAANIYLRHADYDPCRAIVAETIYFDLVPLREAYLNQHGQLEPIQLNIFEYFEEQPGSKIEVVYTPQ